MYCDAQGRSDPNGDFQMIGGKTTLRPGRGIGFDLAFIDTAPASGSVFLRDNSATFSDAERQFADSAEGQCVVAYARSCHRLSTGHLGDRAPEFTDARAAAAIKAEVAKIAAGQRYLDQMTAHADQLERGAEEARQRGIAGLNGWRN
jgi:hypothetical protein